MFARTIIISAHLVVSHIHFVLSFSVDCVWSDWSDWDTCTVTCGGGTQGKTRTEAVAADYGGVECDGDAAASQACGEDPCPSK